VIATYLGIFDVHGRCARLSPAFLRLRTGNRWATTSRWAPAFFFAALRRPLPADDGAAYMKRNEFLGVEREGDAFKQGCVG